MESGVVDRRYADSIRADCSVEVLELGQLGVDDKAVDWVRYMCRGKPSVDDIAFQRRMSNFMFRRMLSGPTRFASLRYRGGDIDVKGEGGFTLKTNSIVGINTSKQTFAYPEDWFRRVLTAGGKQTMDDLTVSVTSEKSPYPFQPFGKIQELDEGPLRPGVGAGFLLLVLVDDRFRGMGLSQPLLSGVLKYYSEEAAVPYVFAYGRVPDICKDSDIVKDYREHDAVPTETLNRYLSEVQAGRRQDWGVGLHQKAGAHIICGLPDSIIYAESLNSGYLAIYDLKELKSTGKM